MHVHAFWTAELLMMCLVMIRWSDWCWFGACVSERGGALRSSSFSVCLRLIPPRLLSVHAACYVTHQPSAQGGDTIQLTRGKHGPALIGACLFSISIPSSFCFPPHFSSVLVSDALFLVRLDFCASPVRSLCFRQIQLWSINPASFRRESWCCFGCWVAPWRQIRWWPWWLICVSLLSTVCRTEGGV